MTDLAKLKSYIDSREKAQSCIENARKIVKEALLEAVQPVFEKYPVLQYFTFKIVNEYNDQGYDDNVYTEYCSINGVDGYSIEEGGDDEVSDELMETYKQIQNELAKVLGFFYQEDYIYLFEVDYEISIDRNGKIERDSV